MFRSLLFVALLAYTQVSGLISSFYIESTNPFITEIGYFVGHGVSSWFYLGAMVLLFFSYLISHRLCDDINNKYRFLDVSRVVGDFNAILAVVFGAIALSLLIVHVIVSGAPFFGGGATRFSFWKEFAIIKLLAVFPGELALPVLILLAVAKVRFEIFFPRSKKWINLCNFFIVGYFFYLLLLGHKFQGFLVALLTLMPIVFVARINSGVPVLSRNEVVFFVMVLSSALFYSMLFFENSEGGVIDEVGRDAEAAVLYRIFVLQGYAWPAFFGLRDSCHIYNDGNLMNSAIYNIAAFPGFFVERGINLANIFPAILMCSDYGVFLIVFSMIFIGVGLGILASLAKFFLLSGSIFRVSILLLAIGTTSGAFPAGAYGIDFFVKISALILGVAFLDFFVKMHRNINLPDGQ